MKSLQLPQVQLLGGGKVQVQQKDEQKRILELGFVPIGLTCGLFMDKLINDPTLDEEKVMEQIINVVTDDQKNVIGIFLDGGGTLLDAHTFSFCMQLAEARYKEIVWELMQCLH
eukprot:TRINITY_DN27776_c0_g1_i1.p3 TRINITY_DN27776_c0_g1~~TRINITY_DN27776_c0_g1_i1.p3  ORF type:complete len:114 (-),score=10.32 TRINITY_DN27776_c0_g1_i1:223-564(-)